MPPLPSDLDSFTVKIFSCHYVCNQPVSIASTKPDSQNVLLNQPIQTWQAKKIRDGVLRLSIGGYPFTGVDPDGNVTVFMHPEYDSDWYVTYQKDGYLIELPSNRNKVWTADFSDDSTNPRVRIVIKDRYKKDDDISKKTTQWFDFVDVVKE
ncbi:hypothetical protein EV363DRAFT_1330073 [Boletus edulis]|nr:hypothetical protein EV363DRAFT_1330073 [Boletus edulis]